MTHDMQYTIHEIKEEMYRRDQMVLKYSLQYPEFSSDVFRPAVNILNRHYRGKAAISRQQLRQSLYYQAVRALDHAIESDNPFHPFEAVNACTVTYNQDCTVSLFFDAYRYTGGAHGSTIRTSDTWDLPCGRRTPMARFFAPSAAYKTYVLGAVTDQIAAQMQDGNGGYFEDYQSNAARYFNANSFFLTPEGLVVYYQQYQIAPYASGLPQFLLPFCDDVRRPRCR